MTGVDYLVLLALAVVFSVGVAFGRGQASQRRVDALLRRETRFRHPTSQVRPMASPTMLERRWQPAELKRAVCGKAVHTSHGTVRCLAEPGHPGAC